MVDEDLGEEGGVLEAAFVGEAEELDAGDDLTGGVLKARQAKASHLRPVFWDVREVFGVDIDLLEEPPLGLEGSEVVFGLMFFSFNPYQVFLAPDSADGLERDGQTEVPFDPLGAEGRQASFEFDGFLSLGRVDFSGRVLGGAALRGQALFGAWLPAAEPLAHGLGGGFKGSCGWFDAVLRGKADQTIAEFDGVFTLRHDLVKWVGAHG